jgi:hypothetical protein
MGNTETRLKSERNEQYKVGRKKGSLKREQSFKGTKLRYTCVLVPVFTFLLQPVTVVNLCVGKSTCCCAPFRKLQLTLILFFT